MRHFIDDSDLVRGERIELLERAWRFKHGDRKVQKAEPIRSLWPLARRVAQERAGASGPPVLEHHHLALVMTKPSLRTRVSLSVAVRSLGGEIVEVGPQNTKLGQGEDIREWAGVLGRLTSGIIARVHEHQFLDDLRTHASVPVINALSDDLHPLQGLADAFTVWESARFAHVPGAESCTGYFSDQRRWAWIGDGNNVAHSVMLTCASLGITLAVASPDGRRVNPRMLAWARSLHPRGDAGIELHATASTAVEAADAVFTDTWVSMGHEGRHHETELEAAFASYRVDDELMARAGADAVFMHCLPAQPGREVSVEVLRGPRSRVLEGAENRMWTARVLLEHIFAPY